MHREPCAATTTGRDTTVQHQSSQFARSHFQDGLASQEIFEHKGSLEPSTTDVPDLPFGLNQFIQFPASDPAWCPHFVLAVLAIKQLVIAAWETAKILSSPR